MNLLYACVLEAQRSGDKRQASIALQEVLAKYKYSAPAGVHLPALLRCTAKLLISQLPEKGKGDPKAYSELGDLYEGASSRAKSSLQRAKADADQQFVASELDWFARSSYNLLVSHHQGMGHVNAIRFAKACLEFLELLRKSSNSPEKTRELAQRQMVCDWICAKYALQIARDSDEIQVTSTHCKLVQQFAADYRRTMETLGLDELDASSRELQQEVQKRYHQILLCDAEAAVSLDQFDRLEALVQESVSRGEADLLEKFGDLLLLTADAGRERGRCVAMQRVIVEAAWAKSAIDAVKLSRWIRCLFRLSLSTDKGSSLHFLGVALSAVRRDSPRGYPGEEIEWLCATAFNRAVDLFCAGDDEGYGAWADAAVALADAGGLDSLEAELREKYGKMKWKKKEA